MKPEEEHWFWANINMNPVALQGYGNWEAVFTATHEIGHAIGLAHTNSVYVLMHPRFDQARYNYPTADDIAGVKAMYPR